MNWFDWLSVAGSGASLIGLLVSLWLLREVSQIKTRYRERVRTPQLLRSLDSVRKRLRETLLAQGSDRRQDVDEELAKLEAVAVECARIISGPVRRAAKNLSAVTVTRARPTTDAEAWLTYEKAAGLQQALSESGKSQDWSQ